MFSSYGQTVQRYRSLQAAAHRYVLDAVTRNRIVDAPLRLDFIDDRALDAWRGTWAGRRQPPAAGGWDWPVLHARRRRPSAFDLAIWSGPELCSLALGHLSKTRSAGLRHTVSVDFLEGVPFPHPLKGSVALLAVAFAEVYGRELGASRIRLVEPLPGAIPIYERMDFAAVFSGGRAIYCERRIEPMDESTHDTRRQAQPGPAPSTEGGWPRRVREPAAAAPPSAAVQRMHAGRGILDTLTPEDIAFIQGAARDQPEVLGTRGPRRRG